jgi:hypothetical protein
MTETFKEFSARHDGHYAHAVSNEAGEVTWSLCACGEEWTKKNYQAIQEKSA